MVETADAVRSTANRKMVDPAEIPDPLLKLILDHDGTALKFFK